MGLTLEVDRNGKTETVELDLTPDGEGGFALPLTDRETVSVVALCGHEAFQNLADGGWDTKAADAILYVKLFGGMGDVADDAPAWTQFSVDWSEVGLAPPDTEMESGLAELSGDL